jgi:hypothetical protein
LKVRFLPRSPLYYQQLALNQQTESKRASQ